MSRYIERHMLTWCACAGDRTTIRTIELMCMGDLRTRITLSQEGLARGRILPSPLYIYIYIFPSSKE